MTNNEQDSRYRFSFSPGQFWSAIVAGVLLLLLAYAAGLVTVLLIRK